MTRSANVRMRVTLVYEYEINPDDYDVSEPMAMAVFDVENDPAFILDTDWMVKSAEWSAT